MQVAVFGRTFPSYARENIATMFSKFSMLNVDVWVFEPLYEFLQKETGLRPKVAGLYTGHADLPAELDFLVHKITSAMASAVSLCQSIHGSDDDERCPACSCDESE